MSFLSWRRIAQTSEQEESFSGEVEVERVTSALRVRGNAVEGEGKIPVVGLLIGFSHYVKLYKSSDYAHIHGRVPTKHDSYRWVASYDGLIVNGYRHYRVFHSNDEFFEENLMH